MKCDKEFLFVIGLKQDSHSEKKVANIKSLANIHDCGSKKKIYVFDFMFFKLQKMLQRKQKFLAKRNDEHCRRL